jgi:branched-chain amino acid transport system ATP-binding protein
LAPAVTRWQERRDYHVHRLAAIQGRTADEPSVGLSPVMVSVILKALAHLNENGKGLTILLVEQNVAQTLRVASRAYVLESGRITLKGSAADLLGDPAVKRAYLGI